MNFMITKFHRVTELLTIISNCIGPVQDTIYLSYFLDFVLLRTIVSVANALGISCFPRQLKGLF